MTHSTKRLSNGPFDTPTKASSPEPRTYSGKFQLRVGPDLHRRLAVLARQEGTTLKELINLILTDALARRESGKDAPQETRDTSAGMVVELACRIGEVSERLKRVEEFVKER